MAKTKRAQDQRSILVKGVNRAQMLKYTQVKRVKIAQDLQKQKGLKDQKVGEKHMLRRLKRAQRYTEVRRFKRAQGPIKEKEFVRKRERKKKETSNRKRKTEIEKKSRYFLILPLFVCIRSS